MRRTHAIIAAVTAFAVLAVAGIVWFLRSGDGPRDTGEEFLAAWQRGDAAAMRALTAGAPADFEQRVTRVRDDLGVVKQRFSVSSVGDPKDGRAGGSFRAEYTLAGNRTWAYDGTLPFVERDGEWRVAWSPRLFHPSLAEGQRLRASRSWPDRAAVQAADGTDLRGSSSGSVAQLVGPTGPASAEAAGKLGAPYRQGDPVGTDGLQKQYEKRLAGTPAMAVQIVDAEGSPVKTLQRFGGTEGQPLRTTLDLKVQEAAGKALGDVGKPASLVAVRPSTGEILAVANKPGGYNRALMGRYPPGSTFKVVTAAALVAGGLGVTTPVGCPATTTIGGRTFKNSGNEAFGTVPFREAFAHSCNTTMADQTVKRLDQERLAQVAGQFGFNAPIIAGLPAVRASFPGTRDDTALASASFGQGEVLTSPLNMASVAAAAASGTWRSPRLVDAALASQAVDAGGRRPEAPKRLEPAVRKALRTLMPAVVSEGTAAGVDFPSGTAGKTGTAEFGTAAPGQDPPTHAWFIGYRGDVAFAVIVEDGGTGAGAAAPIAARFLRSL
ncbi:penicillin-binding transpeptidase domain-containing protein [Actinomadura sp. 21ATH]|uniref:penicillin-binding transpeptidase domain-containing protein n=1 Tax=Actinomadura sp. 21ATH TaxID=1735444 RepID=UPI0035BF4AC6